jgi:transcriptional regulator with XRE-family HTH domain/tetratricopeptide (TPR) repeat protein
VEVFRHDVLRTARLELGLTQEQVARSLGVDIRTYRRYESGAVNHPQKGFSVVRAGRRQLLARIGEELGIAADELVGLAETSIRAAVGHVLPPGRAFEGREAELARLAHWAGSSEGPRVQTIVAMGGAGKSSLVQQWLSRHDADPLVWSFYEDPRAEAFLAAALSRLEESPAPTSTSEVLERLLVAVEQPAQRLLVLDGFEVMQSDGRGRSRGSIDDPLLRRLLTTIAARPGGTRVLITSRLHLVDLDPWGPTGAQTIELPPLSPAAQRDVLRQWGVEGTDAELDRALERFGGHALSVATLGSLVTGSYGGDLALATAVDLDDAGTEDPLAHRLGRLLDRYADSMSDTLREVLARIVLFPRGVGVDTLFALTRDPSLRGAMPTTRRALIQALSRLETRGLVHRSRATSSRYSVHPFVADHFRSRSDFDAAPIHDARRIQLRAQLEEAPRGISPAERLDALEDLLVHTRLAGHAREAFAVYERRFGGFSVLGLQRGDMVRGARLLRGFLEDDEVDAQDPALQPWEMQQVLYEQALYASAMGDPGFALACLGRYVDSTRDDPRSNTTGLRTMAYVLRLAGRFDDALDAIDRALAAAPDQPDHRLRNLALEGAIRSDMGDFEAATACFDAARRIDARPRFRRALWEAEHLLENGDVDRALAMTRNNRDACVRQGWPGHVSHCDTVLGLCLADAEPDTAHQHRLNAERWAFDSGEVEARLRCYELELRLELPGPRRDALQNDAVAIARGCGFGRFVQRFQRESP